jgi:3',5'-cyclic-nucleotide phosphodiesterase
MLHKGRLGDAYEAWELFTIVVAAICHDTNHQGFNNIYNIKAETPLGILFKDTSVMEMHHITQSIPVINMDKVSLFHSFKHAEVKQVWALFIKIILSTDMAKHFELVKKAQAAVDEGTFDMSNDEYRLLGLQLIMKVSDISNVSRPFEIADKWCDILNEEFFHQGDLEKQSGIGLTSPLNDRETSNKPKSQIGFYNFICLPLYTVVARLYTPLQVQVDQVKANLERWKALVAAPPS